MQTENGVNLLLKGVVGSTAFGLKTKNSDTDYGAVFVLPTTQFLGLSTPQESYSLKDPDMWFHEVGKYVRLALKCNPTTLELLWLNDYEVISPLGQELVNLRYSFLSQKYVHDAYFGYAKSQLSKLSKDPRPEKRAKNARHFMRILSQGYDLYALGDYSVRLEDPQFFWDFGLRVGYDSDYEYAEKEFLRYEKFFNFTASPLPEKPNVDAVENFLQKVRREFYSV